MTPGRMLRDRLDEWSRRAAALIDVGTQSEWMSLWEAVQENVTPRDQPSEIAHRERPRHVADEGAWDRAEAGMEL
jgi:hypothetical protein